MISTRNTARAGKGYTAAQAHFAQVPDVQIPRSKFDRSSALKTAFDSGYLVPVFADEAIPGDTMAMRMASFVRMATPIFPVMDNFYLDVFFFAVPNRLLWDKWQRFMGEQPNPGDTTDFAVPEFTAYTATEGTLSDYIGIPINTTNDLSHSSLWHRAYNLIWNEWFRDQNLQDAVVVDTDDGPDDIADYTLLRRGKRHDYLSGALPFPQKGDAVELPLGTTAPVERVSNAPAWIGYDQGTDTLATATGLNLDASSQLQGSGEEYSLDPDGGLVANLSTATAATINQIREAFQVQRLLERDARGGTRYTEIIRSHFGVDSPDQRLQRPEYLGGGSVRINVHPVAATDAFSQEVGVLSAFVTAAVDGIGFTKSFVEHSVIIGMVNIRADLTYQQGLERQFSRSSRYEFYWPSLAHLGEQEVLNKEIYAQGDASPDDAAVWGYQERYAEYRYKPSRTSGVMRSTATTPIDPWHLGLEFASLPLLNDTYIQDQPPFERVVKDTVEPEFFGDFYFQYHCARPMPVYSVPGFVDHF